MRAKLVFSLYYEINEYGVVERLPPDTEGRLEPCTCVCTLFDYHFFPDCWGGKTLIGVTNDEIIILDEKVSS